MTNWNPSKADISAGRAFVKEKRDEARAFAQAIMTDKGEAKIAALSTFRMCPSIETRNIDMVLIMPEGGAMMILKDMPRGTVNVVAVENDDPDDQTGSDIAFRLLTAAWVVSMNNRELKASGGFEMLYPFDLTPEVTVHVPYEVMNTLGKRMSEATVKAEADKIRETARNVIAEKFGALEISAKHWAEMDNNDQYEIAIAAGTLLLVGETALPAATA